MAIVYLALFYCREFESHHEYEVARFELAKRQYNALVLPGQQQEPVLRGKQLVGTFHDQDPLNQQQLAKSSEKHWNLYPYQTSPK